MFWLEKNDIKGKTKKWQCFYEVLGNYRDQPAFNVALYESGSEFSFLEHRYNAQLWNKPRVAVDAVILHYFSTLTDDIPDRLLSFIRAIEQGGEIDRSGLKRLIQSRKLWTPGFWDGWRGRDLVRMAVGELGNAGERDGIAADIVDRLFQTDVQYGRRVLAKLLVDSYWSGQRRAAGFAFRMLFRHYPLGFLRSDVRGCVLHYVRFRLKRILRRE